MGIDRELDLHLTRRQLFGLSARGIGIGSARVAARRRRARRRRTRRAMRRPAASPACRTSRRSAKRVIYLHQSGGPSQLETFDYKPELAKFQGTEIPDSVRQGQRVTQTMGQSLLPVAPSMFEFAQHGKSGTWVSELLPHTAKIVDDITVIKTMNTDAINHDPAITFIQTGSSSRAGRAWARGSATASAARTRTCRRSSCCSRRPRRSPPISRCSRGSGPAGSCRPAIRASGSAAAARPVLYLDDPPGVDARPRGDRCSTPLPELNTMKHEAYGDPEIETRIAQYEMAYRMQTSVPELIDLSKEPDSIFELYGPDVTQARHVRRQLPAGAPAGRARRAVHPALSPRLGPARQPAARHRAAVQGHRPADRRARHRPQAARAARRHAGRLGRRVRPHRVQPGQADRRQLRPRPPPAQLLHVDGRRRHEARHR